MNYTNCQLCPRQCGVDRTAGEKGFCKSPAKALVAKTMLHTWEEPVLAKKYSGAIFFGGCTLGCRYCQNAAISRAPIGKELDAAELRQEMEKLISQGAENIDLVTPTQYLPTILQALAQPLPVPVIYNCGGYERVETVRALKDKVDIFLPDFKYADNALALTLSGAKDYFETAGAALKEMVLQTGKLEFDGDILKKGVIVRHLILPGQVENSLKVLDYLGENFAPGEILVSLMRQYTPMPGMQPPYDRPITDAEYESVLSWMYLNNLQGLTQEQTAASENFIPDF